ncbi:MAG: cyclic nucleotide-binding domain-containing protein [Nitrospirae bacterium]|nr:cyclic nucleotide-binding domain-containing protein [Nitrospirota bacterium]
MSIDYVPFLLRVPFFAAMDSEEELLRIASRVTLRRYAKGDVVYREGDVGDALYIIRTGRVRISVRSEAGVDRPVAYLGAGEIFGEMALLIEEPRSATVRADTAAEIIVLLKEDFHALLREDPAIALELSRTLSRRLARTTRGSERRVEPVCILCASFGAAVSGAFDGSALLAARLAPALAEQNTHRVVLVDLHADGEASAARLLAPDSRRVKISELASCLAGLHKLEPLMRSGPRGEHVITVERDGAEGAFEEAFSGLVAALKSSYLFIVIALPGSAEAVPRSILLEPDQIWVPFLEESRSAAVDRIEALTRSMSGLPYKTHWLWLRREEDRDRKRSTIEVDLGRPLRGTVDLPSTLVKPPEESEEDSAGADTAFRKSVSRLARQVAHRSTGVALGSGAAFGFAHVGVLQALDQAGIDVDYIAGTSMGALVGSFYASGLNADALAERAIEMQGRGRFLGLADFSFPPRTGFLRGEKVDAYLREILEERTFADLEIPFACVATDILTGERVVLDRGPVHSAVRASLSLPFVFAPVRIEGRLLVDGGLVEPVPAATVKNLGADLILSVNVAAKPKTASSENDPDSAWRAKSESVRTPNMLKIGLNALYTMQHEIALAADPISHLTLAPEFTGIVHSEFHRAGELIEAGRRAAEARIDEIRSLFQTQPVSQP